MPLPTDPLLSQQWHLHNPNPLLLDLNVFGVWNPAEGRAYTGAGVRTVIIDDGFDYTHPDFDNYDQSLDFDFVGGNDYDPFGLGSDAHGTAVTGIIGAAADGTGAVGVSYGASLVGYRTEGLINDDWLVSIAEAIGYASTNALGDTINISQGIANDLDSEFGNGYNAARFDAIETAIGTVVDSGRGNLGGTIIKSAGNSRVGNYDVNSDDWTNDTRQVVVAAVDQNGFVSSYSSYGAAILVSGFGTPGEVVTTDRVGADGYDLGDFTSTFNGTSSAAPMVTGVVNLMYDANGGLGWRDVQTILAMSARHVGSAVGAGHAAPEQFDWGFNAASTWNGGGMHFSNDYGYGLVDALAAVRLAETWLFTGTAAATSTNQFSNYVDVLNVATIIPDGNLTGTNFTGEAFFNDYVERVTVQMTFSTTFMGDVEIYLTSPDGTVSQLIADQAGGLDFNGTWTFETQAFRGERAAGNWTVRVVDDAGGDVLTVSDIVIRTFGMSSANDRYVFTNEYSDYAGLFGHVQAVVDANGGVDTVNAAAVSSASVIYLNGVSGFIDGTDVSFSNIENAIGGDGGDQIFGSDIANQLFGMRGNDMLNGLGGDDTLTGGTGNDTLNAGTGVDSLSGGVGDDVYVIDGSDIIDEDVGGGIDRVASSASYQLAANVEYLTLTGTAALTGIGNALNNVLNGNSGANTLNGITGTDTMSGGMGDDVYVTDGGDIISELAAAGTDRVMSSAGHSLSANVENLTLTGAASINGYGNSLNNLIYGNSGNNVLGGGNGNDTMNGTTGTDTLIGGLGDDVYTTDGGDILTEAAAAGTDRVYSTASYGLSVNLENLTLIGGAAINGYGNTLNNIMTGNGANNVLGGGNGNDTLNGTTGADTLIGGLGDDVYTTDGGDTLTEAAAAGTDSVFTSASLSLSANLENLTLTGAAAINGYGNVLANSLTGNSGNNVLGGGDGNDTLNGAAGTDTLTGGTGADTFIFNTALGATNIDRITDFSVVDDTIRLENAIFTGLANGALAVSAFAANLTGLATDALDRIIYETDTGRLMFDADGSGAGAGVQFGVLTAGLALTNVDFFVV
ncbi:S8 family serine peptidase [Rhodobacter ferrooxidans]|uniref:Furin n=1 Tax=Rhodobacter ferrooxidans TaxID=371731 RepID=C8S3M2_9RHOB|nr:S8 family serine peptidase [Rhodobacter sp. SW2]EEW24470.1 Furin [Rhodobacter sp. SW2]